MATEHNHKIETSAEPGKGAAGNQQAVQVAQPVGDAVQPEGTKSFPGGTPEEDAADIQAAKESEADSDLKTTDGYVIDDSGRMNNFAVEPEMYVEK